ncbi:MAG: T9SS type A sorting domain-containing protein [Flavobacteriales bacterium]|nr:MAG: T9SS type A sorting domain-containing protein [Flavobacteriales bacterium]
MKPNLTSVAVALLIPASRLLAQVSEPGFENSNQHGTYIQCVDIGCSGCTGDPWQGYSDMASPANSYFRTPQPGLTGGGGYQPTSQYHPAPEDDIPGNTRYMVLRLHDNAAVNNGGSLTMGVVNPLVISTDPGCEYQLTMRWAAKAGYGASQPVADVTISAILGTDLHLNCANLDHATGTTIATTSTTIIHDGSSDIGTWLTLTGSVEVDQLYNSIAIEVTVSNFDDGSGYDVYLDDVQLAKVDENCAPTCCNAECPADFSCDGSVNNTDLLTFIGIYGTYTNTIEDPCLQLGDFDNDGVVGVDDLLAFMGLYYGVPCPGGMVQEQGSNIAPETKVTVMEAHVQQNPTNGRFLIEHGLSGSGAIDIMLIDHTGRMLRRSTDADQQVIALDVTGEPAGTYTAVFHRSGTLSTVQLVKE